MLIMERRHVRYVMAKPRRVFAASSYILSLNFKISYSKSSLHVWKEFIGEKNLDLPSR